MDAASVLEQQTQSMSNLPAELKYLLLQIREKDMALDQVQRKIRQEDLQLQKFVKQYGSLVRHPKERQMYERINEGYQKAAKLQNEKCLIANTALYLLTKHLTSLEKDAIKLEASGEPKILGVDPDATPMDIDSAGSVSSSAIRASFDGTPSPTPPSHRRASHRSRSRRSRSRSLSHSDDESSDRSYSRQVTPAARRRNMRLTEAVPPVTPKVETGVTRVSGRKKLERGASGTVIIPRNASGRNNEDNELYCFCRQVSYGNMIACDNQNCRYEWFHYGCVGLTEPPKGIWYCPDCRKQMELEEKKKR